MRSLLLLIAFVGSAATLPAQLPIYNADFVLSKNIRSKGELGDSLKIMGIVDRTYEVFGAKIIEYYEMSTSEFLGFAGDTTKFPLEFLPYLRRSPTMRRLVKEFGPAEAHDIRQGEYRAGILKKDLLELKGWPKKRERNEGQSWWIYDDMMFALKGNEVTEVMKTGS